jgi:hypothetical protein
VSILGTLAGCTPYITEYDVAVNVNSMMFSFSGAAPLTQAVIFAAQFGSGGHTVSINSTARPRASATSNLVNNSGTYTLCLPACEVTNAS